MAHPTGIVEVEEGELAGDRIELRSSAVSLTASAKEVAAVERTFEVDGDVLRYTVRDGRRRAAAHPSSGRRRSGGSELGPVACAQCARGVPRGCSSASGTAWRARRVPDELIVEEPLEIRLDGPS